MSVATPVVLNWNGSERRIYLKQGVTEFHWIEDIYKEYRNERKLDEDLRKYNAFMIASGNEAKGGGKATPRLLKLLEDVKVIPFDEAGEIQVSGEAITDNADIDPTLFDISSITNPVIINYAPPSAEVIVVDSVAKSLDYGGILHFDISNTGVGRGTGQDHPIGTSANPVNNIEDGIAIADLYSLSEVLTKSDIPLDRDVEKYNIRSLFPNVTIYPNGYQMDFCTFNNLTINGVFTDSHVSIFNCTIIRAENIYGEIKDSWYGDEGSCFIKIASGRNLKEADCESGVAGSDSPVVDLNEGNTVDYSARGFRGGKTIINCDTAETICTIGFADGGKPHFEPSCTDGYISLRGNGLNDDRSAGTEIDTIAWKDLYKTDELIQDVLDIVDPQPVNSTPYFTSIETRFKSMYKHSNLFYKVFMNSTLHNSLKNELNDQNLAKLYISGYEITIIISAEYIGSDFNIYGSSTP